MDLLEFSLEKTGRKVIGERAVYSNSLLFKSGDYPEKKFSMTNEDLFKTIENFNGPIPGNIEHTDFLKGRACQIDSLYAQKTATGLNLCGEVSLPLALDEILEDSERKLSCEFERPTGNLFGLALTTNPHIEEAALMSKFKNKTTSHGQYALQDIHDKAARAGAICNFDAAKMTAKPEMKAIQSIHDLATTSGAACKEGTANSYYYSKDEDMDEKSITSSVVEGIKAFFSTGTVKLVEEDKVDPNAKRIEELEKKLEQERTQRFKEYAEGEIDSRVKLGKVLPADRDLSVAALFQARKDDENSSEKVTFSDGSVKTRAELFLSSLDSRPAQNFGRELLPGELANAQVLFNSPEKDEIDRVYKEASEWAKKQNVGGSK